MRYVFVFDTRTEDDARIMWRPFARVYCRVRPFYDWCARSGMGCSEHAGNCR